MGEKTFIEIDAPVEEVKAWLNHIADLPYAASIVDLDNLLSVVDHQAKEIERLTKQTDELLDKVNSESYRADVAEVEVGELKHPSSIRPPFHFKLPASRPSVNHKFNVGMTSLGKGYLIVSFYPGTMDVGELFIHMSPNLIDDPLNDHSDDSPATLQLKRKVNDLVYFLKGMLDQLAIAVSIGLQRGIPLSVYVTKFKYTDFPPSGITKSPLIPTAKSIVDYLFRWMDEYIKANKGNLY